MRSALEEFYRLGFEAALDARHRSKEYDQVLSEMASELDQRWQLEPDSPFAEAFRRGYERGLVYYQSLRTKKAA
jgi:hypothetical protein